MIFAAARKILNCAMKKAPAPTSRFKSNWSGPHRSGRNDLGNQLRVLPANFQANWTQSLTRYKAALLQDGQMAIDAGARELATYGRQDRLVPESSPARGCGNPPNAKGGL